MDKIKIIFMGTPHIANEILKSVLKNDTINVVGVVTQPDKPVGRKKSLTPPLVKTTALEHNLPVFQPERVRKNKELKEKLIKLNADFFLVVAYGQILPPSVLRIPKYIPINIHTSILPKYRGASPIQSALLNRDKLAGVTIMEMNKKMDEGDIFVIKKVELTERDNYFSLENKLIDTANEALITFFTDFINDKIKRVTQNHDEASYCKKIEKTDGLLDFNNNIDSLIGKVRAYSLWPKTYFKYGNITYNVIDANGVEEKHNNMPSTIKINKKSMKIYCKNGYLEIITIQAQSKKTMPISAFFNGIGRNLNDKVINGNN